MSVYNEPTAMPFAASPRDGPAASALADSSTASMQETMQWILRTRGYDALRVFLDRMPTEELTTVLAASEMTVIPPPPRLEHSVHANPLLSQPASHPRPSSLLPSTMHCQGATISATAAAIPHAWEDPTLTAGLPSRAPSIAAPAPSLAAPQLFPEYPAFSSALAPLELPAQQTPQQPALQTPQQPTQQTSQQPALQTPQQPALQTPQQPALDDRSVSLFIESDRAFLDPVHIFLRWECIEVFVATEDDMTAAGRGAKPATAGQVGLRCRFCRHAPRQTLARQAVCFPSKRETIFESVRNYRRTHFGACQFVPQEAKARYEALMGGGLPRRTQKVLKAYYAEAAAELGIVDAHCGLVFGASPNRSGVPSEKLLAIIDAAMTPVKFASLSNAASPSHSDREKAIGMMKFEHMASEGTRAVIVRARREPTAFVRPQDFATMSDADFILFHQFGPYRPAAESLEKCGLDPGTFRMLSGLRCRHCCPHDAVAATRWRGAYFPTDLKSLSDSNFSQTLLNHLVTCPSAPQEIKDALDELRRLADQYGVTANRVSKNSFFKKVWGRMERYYEYLDQCSD